MKTLILYRLKDGFDNKSTLAVRLKEDNSISYVLYGSWQSTGTSFAISNLQLEESLPPFISENSLHELDKKITRVLSTGVETIDHKDINVATNLKTKR